MSDVAEGCYLRRALIALHETQNNHEQRSAQSLSRSILPQAIVKVTSAGIGRVRPRIREFMTGACLVRRQCPGDGVVVEIIHFGARGGIGIAKRQHELRGFAGVADQSWRVEVRRRAGCRLRFSRQSNGLVAIRQCDDVLATDDFLDLAEPPQTQGYSAQRCRAGSGRCDCSLRSNSYPRREVTAPAATRRRTSEKIGSWKSLLAGMDATRRRQR